MMCARCGDDGLGFADLSIDVLESQKQVWRGAGADGDKASCLNITASQFSGNYANPFFGFWVFDPKKIIRQQPAEPAVYFTESFRRSMRGDH
jgi:hypothetical protein